MADRVDISAVARVVDQASGPLKNITGTLKSVGETAASAGSALARMATQGAFGGVAANLKNVGNAFGQVGASVGRLFSPLKKLWPILGLAGGFGIAGAISSIKEYASEIRSLGRLSARTGASTQMIEGLRLMTGNAERADDFVGKLTKGLARLAGAKKVDPRMADILGKANVSLKDLRAGVLPMDEAIRRLNASFAKQTNVTSKNWVAQQLMGKAGAEYLDILTKQPGEIDAAVKAAQERFNVDQRTLDQAAEFTTAQNRLNDSIRGVKNSIIGELIPSITPMLVEFDKWIMQARETWLSNENIRSGISSVAETLKGFWEGINVTITQLGGWGNAMALLVAYMSRDVIGAVGNLGIQIAKLGASAISLDPISLAAAGIGAAAYAAYQNWDTIGPKFEAKFEQISVAAKQAWEGIKSWAATSWQEILKGFQTGGIWGAIVAAGFAAARGIIQSWDKVVGWFESNFPEAAAAVSSTWETIKNAAQTAWKTISTFALQTINDIVAGWRSGGIEGAATATWNAIKNAFTGTATAIGDLLRAIPWSDIGSYAGAAFNAYWQTAIRLHTWLAERINEIDWPGLATNAGNLFLAAWRGAVNFAEWLRSLDWANAGAAVGTALGNAVVVGLKAAEVFLNWLQTVDWQVVVVQIAKGLAKIVDAAADIGVKFIENLVSNMVGAIVSGLGLQPVVDAIYAKMPDWMKTFLGGGAPAQAAAAIPPSVGAAAKIPPAEPTKPLAPSLAPGVAQPGLLAQARETQVQLQGEIAQRIKIDMSPDLRAMLQENTAKINQLGVQIRSAVDVGFSMGPAMGEAA